jgi:hypothetical protein
MDSDRKTAIAIGVLFIVGTVAGILSMLVTNSILTAPDYLAQVGTHQNQMAVGALLVLVMGLSLAMVPVVFYPLGKRYSQVLAMGYVVFRGALETTAYIAVAFGWLVLITLGEQSAKTGGANAAYFGASGTLLVAANSWMFDRLLAIVFSLGALMFYYVLFESRLVPRWLSLWGLAGAALYLGAPLLGMFGVSAGFLMAPLAVQEMVMALWLIVKGFEAPESRATPVAQSRTLVAE